jgi:hypothetical protein
MDGPVQFYLALFEWLKTAPDDPELFLAELHQFIKRWF